MMIIHVVVISVVCLLVLFACLSVYLLVYLFICLFICLFACLSVYLLVYLFICLFICWFACLFACLSVYLLVYLLVCLFICLFICWFACLSVGLLVYLLVCLFICLFAYLFALFVSCVDVCFYITLCLSIVINCVLCYETDGEVFELFVLTSMVTAIKEGLRSKQEVARDEFISLLSSLIQNYSHHPRLSDMATLSNKDPEADFFKNVVHIQLHRRTRAFRKLAKVCSEGVVGQTNCLNFLLPLANHVVFTPSTNTEQNLLAEAVNVIGAISRQLSWTNYSFILGHYLRQLSKSRDIQKNLIKYVTSLISTLSSLFMYIQ